MKSSFARGGDQFIFVGVLLGLGVGNLEKPEKRHFLTIAERSAISF
jgi:hypothetical protein